MTNRTSMRSSAIAGTILLLLALTARAQSGVLEGGGIVYGDELGVGVQAPRGWMFDSQSGVDQGLYAVMYPEGSTWGDSTAVMYVRVANLGEGETLEQFIAGDVAAMKGESPQLEVAVGGQISMSQEASAEVRYFSNDQWGNHEAVAYAASGGQVALFVLSCRTREDFDASLESFGAMVSSSFLAKMVFEKESESRRGPLRRAGIHV